MSGEVISFDLASFDTLYMSMFNDDFLDMLSVLSFLIGVMNYGENLSQSDKDDLMHELDEKTNSMLERIESDLEIQNEMLREILKELRKE